MVTLLFTNRRVRRRGVIIPTQNKTITELLVTFRVALFVSFKTDKRSNPKGACITDEQRPKHRKKWRI